MLFTWENKRVAVTGAGSGLGLALLNQLNNAGVEAKRIPREHVWNEVSFDCVILNAAVGHIQSTDIPVLEDADHMFLLNFLNTVKLAQKLLASDVKHIHVVGSVVSHVSAPHLALYSASKYALRGWAYGAARDLPGRVSISYPNGMKSEFFNNICGQKDLIEKYTVDAGKAQIDYDSPDVVAKGILEGIQWGAREIIPSQFSYEWFVKNEVDIRRMWYPTLKQPSQF